MKIGDPLDRSTDHGPQNHRAHMEKLVEYCDIGVKEGATLVTGGKQVDRPGEFKWTWGGGVDTESDFSVQEGAMIVMGEGGGSRWTG